MSLQIFASVAALLAAYKDDASEVLANAGVVAEDENGEIYFIEESSLGTFKLPLSVILAGKAANNELGRTMYDGDSNDMTTPAAITLCEGLKPMTEGGKYYTMASIASAANMSVTTLHVGSAGKPTKRTATIWRREDHFEVTIA